MSTVQAADGAIAGARPAVFWSDREAVPVREPLAETEDADLLIIGAGLTGLWAAVQAIEDHPERSVVVLEGERVAFGASGRNGGFCVASITHGIPNGMARWPDEMDTINSMGRENFAAIIDTIMSEGIECNLERNGLISVATERYQLDGLREDAATLRRFGWNVEELDGAAMRAEVDSPTYQGGMWLQDGCALLDPAGLAWGLAAKAERTGVLIHEQSPVLSLRPTGSRIVATCPKGQVRARRVLLATSAFPPLVRAIRRYVVPVYDYVLVTEPLVTGALASIGWDRRQGLRDLGNQFHYYRLTPDNRILWGGYDAVYHYGNDMGPHRDQRHPTFNKLAGHFFATFPQLRGLRFAYRWGGAIDTCSRFCALFGLTMDERVAYAVGFTGSGVGASRFGGRVALDLLDGADNARTRLTMVRKRPLPFPPEPLRVAAIEVTRGALARADRQEGRRGPWLRVLDRFGVGFDS
jgi:glycine/D-amino acid oxidase-like deaminating enzyme